MKAKEYKGQVFYIDSNIGPIEYGHYDGKRWPVGTRLTSDESGEIIEASSDTPEDEIVKIVEPDK